MKLSSLFYAGSIVALLGLAPSAQAAPITYQLSSIASGQIGPTSFTNVLVTLIATGDTANVAIVNYPGVPFDIYVNPFSTFTVTIPGVGTAIVTEPSAIWSFPDVIPTFNPLPAVLFGRIDDPPAMDSFTAVGFVFDAALGGYNNITAVGPITGLGFIGFNPDCSTPGNNDCIQTSMGLLRFTTNDAEDGHQGSFVASVAPTAVPEPATLVLLGSGVAALAGRSRVRTRKSGEESRQV
jgi:hypothetical protein